MTIIEGTKENFDTEVLKSDVPVLVDFNAEWCPPCQALHPILEELAEEGGDFKIVSVDIDDQDELAEEYEVSSIPCLVVFNGGEETDRKVGLQPKKRLQKMLGVK
ncbi:thioredoxin [Candidatus Saccharibacteria bacterium]|nr:thioredoxin [Candidatus Saccharibacteria bacterium]